jgi:hypothetical protein
VTVTRIVGIDPGPIPGIVVLSKTPVGTLYADAQVVQCSHQCAATVLRSLLYAEPATPTAVQIERFVVGRKSMRSAAAGEVTRTLIGELREVWETYDSTTNGRLGGHWFERSASQVKPWATDTRLAAAGLLDATKGMRHAKDAARHALYCAVHDGGIPDPLSRKAHR